MNRSTPISRSISAALTRVLNFAPRGYCWAFSGAVAPEKAAALAAKFDQLYGIADSPSQRLTRKRAGRASAVLTLYAPPGASVVHWLVLCTDGTGMEGEKLKRLDAKPWVQLAGYDLVRHNDVSGVRWTWRRPKAEMAQHHGMLRHLCGTQKWDAVGQFLASVARQPGFHGVRKQTYELCLAAKQKGYTGEWPPLYAMRKVSHGEPLILPVPERAREQKGDEGRR